MKRFNQHQINENETIDSMGHDMQLSPKRKKQLESDKGVFEDFPTQMWLDYTPKPNSSDYVKNH